MTSLLSDLARTASGFIAWLFASRGVRGSRKRMLAPQTVAAVLGLWMILVSAQGTRWTGDALSAHALWHEVATVIGASMLVAVLVVGLRTSWRDVRGPRVRRRRYGPGYHSPPG